MDKEIVMKYKDKEVMIILGDGNKYFGIVKEVNADSVLFFDKFGKNIGVALSSISLIKEEEVEWDN